MKTEILQPQQINPQKLLKYRQFFHEPGKKGIYTNGETNNKCKLFPVGILPLEICTSRHVHKGRGFFRCYPLLTEITRF